MPTSLPDNKASASAKVVMHHFARSEVRLLNKGADALHGQIVAKLRTLPEFASMTDAQIAGVIQSMTQKLQSFDLTINFKCFGWFDQPNHYKTYTQMYERGTRTVTGAGGVQERRLAGNGLNSASSRDAADTKVSFGPNASSPSMQGVARFMQTGGVTQSTDPSAPAEFVIANKQFNPKAKPIFAALNVGNRSCGANTGYGSCHLVLKDHFKKGAIYYMGDTFGTGMDHTSRVTYGTLPALILHASDAVLRDIVDACHHNKVLMNTSYGPGMVEAHVYDQIIFSQSVKEVVVSRLDMNAAWGHYILSGIEDGPSKEQIENNAKIFAGRNHIKIRFVA